jgi:hypothetical protein
VFVELTPRAIAQIVAPAGAQSSRSSRSGRPSRGLAIGAWRSGMTYPGGIDQR